MILFKKRLFDLEVKGQCHMKVIMVHDTPPYGHAPTYQVSLRRSRRKNQTKTMSPFVRRRDIIKKIKTKCVYKTQLFIVILIQVILQFLMFKQTIILHVEQFTSGM